MVEVPGHAVIAADFTQNTPPKGVVQIGNEPFFFGDAGFNSSASSSATTEAWAVR